MGKGGKCTRHGHLYKTLVFRQEGGRNCVPHSGSGGDRAQATANYRISGQGRSAVTGICQELPMMLLGVQFLERKGDPRSLLGGM